MEEVKEINTTKGVLQYYRDWEHEGAVVMLNAQTIDRYKELKDEHPDTENYAVFFAFGNNQFSKGYQKLVHRGCIKNGDKLYHAGAGLYGTKEGLDKFFDFYNYREVRIKEECDPQEVYFYEYNNHECMFTSDEDAIKEVKRIFGKDVVKKIKRI